MKLLWAPWRIEYILALKKGHCFLCDALNSDKDEKNLVLYRGKATFVILNKFPYNPGHLMVAPTRHLSDLTLLEESEQNGLMELVSQSVSILRKVMNPEGFNIGINLGKAAGAGLGEHIHVHVVPRWGGDTNFMPVLAEVKVVPEHIKETYWKLEKEFRSLQRVGGG